MNFLKEDRRWRIKTCRYDKGSCEQETDNEEETENNNEQVPSTGK